MAKVLVVDDEANLRKVLAAMLRRGGYEVTVAAADEQFFEYRNCHPKTGMLRAV